MNPLMSNTRQKLEQSSSSAPIWRESVDTCAFADDERHLGHVIRAGKIWIAYDAVHANPTSNGFRVIGTFASVRAAKEAVERSVEIGWAFEAAGIEPLKKSEQRVLYRTAAMAR